MTHRRIASLLPAATEVVTALGAGDRLVARSHACDHPPRVLELPAMTGSHIDACASSATIDAQVRARALDGLSLFRVDTDALAGCRPDLVLTQDRCTVCAVPYAEVAGAVARLTGGAALLSLSPERLADVWADVARVGRMLGVPEHGTALAHALAGRVERVRARTHGKPAPRVAALEWLDPPMAAGHWVPELIAAAGGADVLGTPGAPARWLSWAELAAAEPDVVLAMPCGFDLARTRRELAALAGTPGWDALRAVRAGRVHALDGNAYFSRPGPRLAESAEVLERVLHAPA